MLARKAKAAETTFADATARWVEVRDRHRALQEQLEGARAAHDLSGLSDWSEAPPVVAERASRYLNGRTPDRDLLRDDVIRLEREVRDQGRALREEREIWHAAQSVELARRLEEIKPRHDRALRQVAQAVRHLSQAVEAETRVRLELVDVRGAAALFGATAELGTVDDPNTPLGRWMLRARAVGVV